MPTLQNSKGETFDVSDVDALKMREADPSLSIVGGVSTAAPSGENIVAMPGEQVARQTGGIAASADEQSAAAHKDYLKDKTSTLGSVARGGLSGLTFGLSDYLADPETIEADEAHHGVARGAASVVGAIAPMFAGDLAGLAGIGGDGLTAERAASGLSSKFLFGGESAAGAGSVERGLGRAGKALAADGAAGEAARAMPELAGLDLKGLDQAHAAELENLVATQKAERAASVADLGSYRAAIKDANPWLVIDEGEGSAQLTGSNKALRKALDDVKGLEKNPATLLKPLRIQEGALQEAVGNQAALAEKFAANNSKLAAGLEEELATLPDTATHVELSGKLAKRYGAFADVKVGKGAVQVAREDAATFLDAMKSGSVAGDGERALGKLPQLLEQNRALQERIETALTPRAELTSPRLDAIRDAKTTLQMPLAPKSMPQQLLEGTVFGHVTAAAGVLGPIAPVVGAKASKLVGDLVFGKLGKAVASTAADSAARVTSFLSAAARSPAPVLATRALANVAFGPGAASPKAGDLAGLYHARSAELRSQTAYNAAGVPEMRPEARAAMAKQLAPIRAVNPLLADKMETTAARRVEYLASVLPRRPEIGTIPIGPDTWKPSDLEMRSFARKTAAAEDPDGVEHRLAAGTMTPEDVEAYNAVYPERAAHLRQLIVGQLPTLTKKLDYRQRLSLSMFTGMPVDPALDPRIFRQLQGNFAAEPNTNGGTSAPVVNPNPSFGSIRKSLEQPTPAQAGRS